MIRNNEGLTKTYNRFHDPSETSPDILRLRELHDAMDRAVLDAYGWTDIRPTCEFLLDYEDEDEEDEDTLTPGPSPASGRGGRGRRKPWRYRWPDEIRDEVLARLLKLNAERAEEERRTGAAAAAAAGKKKAAKTTRKKKSAAATTPPKVKPDAPELFQTQLDCPHWYVLMLLRAWEGRPLTRRALNAGMILMLDDELRTALLDNTRSSRRRGAGEELNHIYTELSIDGFITLDNTGAQQVARITDAAPSTENASPQDIARVEAVKEYFRREQQTGRVTLGEEAVDAEFDFVST